MVLAEIGSGIYYCHFTYLEFCLSYTIFSPNSLFENMERICDEKYVPTPTDVLRARVRTNGIIETHFKINDIIIRYVIVTLIGIQAAVYLWAHPLAYWWSLMQIIVGCTIHDISFFLPVCLM